MKEKDLGAGSSRLAAKQLSAGFEIKYRDAAVSADHCQAIALGRERDGDRRTKALRDLGLACVGPSLADEDAIRGRDDKQTGMAVGCDCARAFRQHQPAALAIGIERTVG